MDTYKQTDNDTLEFDGDETLSPSYESDDQSYPMENINIDTNYYSVFELKRKYDRSVKFMEAANDINSRQNHIILDSDFQREDVWNPKQKSELVESILMGLPIPIMYLFEDASANLIVVDGRQRLTALFEFMDDTYKLTGLSILKKLNGQKFSTIDAIYQAKLEDYQLGTQVIKPPTPDKIKFQIFDRVNRGGTTLNNQEMRNALYQGEATKLLDKLANSDAFKKATQGSLNKIRMKDKYIILRAIAFSLLADNRLKDSNSQVIEYKGDVDEFLATTMIFLNNLNPQAIAALDKEFIRALTYSHQILGERAFRLESMNTNKARINMNVFEVVIYIMLKITQPVNEEEMARIQMNYSNLIKNQWFKDNIANYRDSASRVAERFSKIGENFEIYEVEKHD